MSTNQAQELAERNHGILHGRTIRLKTRQPHIGRTRKRYVEISLQRHQQLAQNTSAFLLMLPVQLKRLGQQRHRPRDFAHATPRRARQAPRHRLQELAGVVEITAPEQRRAFPGETTRGIRAEAVACNHDARGGKDACF
jgi:hypothetical protein